LCLGCWKQVVSSLSGHAQEASEAAFDMAMCYLDIFVQAGNPAVGPVVSRYHRQDVPEHIACNMTGKLC